MAAANAIRINTRFNRERERYCVCVCGGGSGSGMAASHCFAREIFARGILVFLVQRTRLRYVGEGLCACWAASMGGCSAQCTYKAIHHVFLFIFFLFLTRMMVRILFHYQINIPNRINTHALHTHTHSKCEFSTHTCIFSVNVCAIAIPLHTLR